MLRSRTVEEPVIHPIPMAPWVLKAQHQTVPRALQPSPVSLVTVMPSQQLLQTALVTTSRWNITLVWKSSPRGTPCLGTQMDITARLNSGLATTIVSSRFYVPGCDC
jgi:hypothetical protein